MIKLRDYQTESVEALATALRANRKAVPLIVAPTGSGKSVICAEIVRRVFEKRPNARIVCLVPKAELAKQNANKMRELGLSPKFCVASIGPKHYSSQLVVATPGSFAGVVGKITPPHLVICDEAHRFPPDGDGQYRTIRRELGDSTRWCGLTATPYRMSTGSLVGEFFTEIAHDIPLRLLIDRGHLVPPTTTPVRHFDLSKVKKTAGEYQSESMAEAIDAQGYDMVIEALRQVPGRKCGIVFASSIDHAEKVVKVLQSEGWSACAITSRTPKAQRKSLIESFKAGRLRFLVSRDIFVEGFDVPSIDLIVMLRATMSTGLYVQMVGRGMRPFPKKENCLVFDFVGNIDTHGYVDDIRADPFRRKTRRGEARLHTPIELCLTCEGYYSIVRGKCHRCFPSTEKEREYDAPSKSAILSQDEATRRMDVHAVFAGAHRGPRHQCLAVNYIHHDSLGFPKDVIVEFFMFDRSSTQYQRTCKWWQCFYPSVPLPKDVTEAVKIVGQEPPRVSFLLYKIRKERKHKKREIVAYG